MRRATVAGAAGALLLALGAVACKPSSLTPFGIDWREPGSAAQNASGLWSGTTSSGLGVTFQVGDDKVVAFTLSHGPAGCLQEFTADEAAPIDANGAFSLEIVYDQGRFAANGRFTSSTTCSGGYSFEFFSVAGGACPSSGSGTFAATKAP